MPDKKEEKTVRVQFPKDATAESIADAIERVQDEWAKKHPERAHALYPTVYSETGDRIQQDTQQEEKPKKSGE